MSNLEAWVKEFGADEEDYKDKSVVELKALLRARNLRVSGKKKDLIDR